MNNLSVQTEPGSAGPPAKQPGVWREIVRKKAVYAAISPFYILFAVFGIFPIFYSLYLSVHKWDGIGLMSFVGISHYKYLLTEPQFWNAVLNTFEIWILSTIPMLCFALVIAFLMHSSFVRFRTFYRIAYFIPNVTSIVAVAIVFSNLFGSHYGFINFILNTLGLKTVAWLNFPWGIKIAIAAMVVWRWTGYNAIIYLAGLQAIPNTLYEAATIDGASVTQSFLRITIPLLRPVILFTVITSTIGGMQIFTEPQVLVGNSGGVGHGGMTIVLYLYQQAFVNNRFGYGSAVAWALFVIIVVFSIINWKIVQKKED